MTPDGCFDRTIGIDQELDTETPTTEAYFTKGPLFRGHPSNDYSSFDAEGWLRAGGNLGIRLAADDLVIDVDPRHDGDASLNVLSFEVDAELDRAPTNLTGRGDGGRHLFLEKPSEILTVGTLQLYPGLDFKTAGGFVVAPGSHIRHGPALTRSTSFSGPALRRCAGALGAD